jgi:hypothetical protein
MIPIDWSASFDTGKSRSLHPQMGQFFYEEKKGLEVFALERDFSSFIPLAN